MTENPTVRRRRVIAPGETAPAPEPLPLARELAEESDRLGASFVDAAAAIASLQLGVHGEVEITQQGSDDEVTVVWSLTFGKVGDEWSLRIQKWHTDEPEWEAEAMEPSRAPRWVRERAAKVLPALVQQLEKNARDELARVREARTEIEDFVAALRKGVTS